MNITDRIKAGEFDCTFDYTLPYAMPNKQATKQEKAEKHTAFRDACIEHVTQSIASATRNQALLLFERAWADGHADGLHRVFECLEELIEFTQEYWNKR